MELIDFLPALNDLAIGVLAIIVLAWIYKNALDAFQDQNMRHNEQINKMIEALAENNDKLGDLVEAVREGVRRDEDIHRELKDQRDSIEDIKDTVDEIKGKIDKKEN